MNDSTGSRDLISNFTQSALGKLLVFVSELGEAVVFSWEGLKGCFQKPYRIPEFLKQMEFVGNRSLGIIFLTGIFTGLVFSFQVWMGFSLVNADNLVGPTSAIGIFRELGPVFSGLIISARAGGAMAAQLGTMAVTEQIDALLVMGVNPMQYLVSPRMAASIVSLPLLTGFFDFVAMIGAYLLCVHVIGLDEGVFWEKTKLWLGPRDINEGLVKAAVFGLFFSTVCTYRGYKADGGARGVGEATNQGVVISMVSIIVVDYFVTRLFRMLVKAIG